jgi:reverse transcriptase-like protein
VGVDGQTAGEYAAKLEGNLRSLLDRAKAGDDYRAPPVRRVHIPKGDGSKTRPIGIPTFEDKVLQRAVAMVLEAVYEQDFYDCSYGFRPGRSDAERRAPAHVGHCEAPEDADCLRQMREFTGESDEVTSASLRYATDWFDGEAGVGPDEVDSRREARAD